MEKQSVRLLATDWVERNASLLSGWHQTIWNFGETAWREYKSVAWYVERLKQEGFDVEAGSGGMPTAFSARWSNGSGPTLAGYAEYDGLPGNCQAATCRREPRAGLSEHAGGHTDPHSALGMGALGGILAAKHAMQEGGLTGTLRFFGEPAEKMRGSKPIHAAKGYYDDIDAMFSFHPFYMLPLCNTVRWDTHCGAGFSPVYRFTCDTPESWLLSGDSAPIPQAHGSVRAPGANEAVVQMYNISRATRDYMLPSTAVWRMNETILTMGQATGDNLPARLAEIQYFLRTDTVAMAEQVVEVLDANAAAAAAAAHCEWEKVWVSKSRPGLPNHALAEATYAVLEEIGAPKWGGDAIAVAREIQRNLGIEPMENPWLEACEELIEPKEAERILRQDLPPSTTNFTSDDYTEMCWQTPTVRLYIGRPALNAPEGFAYPDWAMNALGGIPAAIDPMIVCAAKTIGATMARLLCEPEILRNARDEFNTRTGGGIGGSKWIAPLCDYEPPIGLRWPEYVTTARGEDWCIPSAGASGV